MEIVNNKIVYDTKDIMEHLRTGCVAARNYMQLVYENDQPNNDGLKWMIDVLNGHISEADEWLKRRENLELISREG